MLGALLGLLAGIGHRHRLERLDRRIRTRADAEDAFGLPVLAEVPELSSTQQRTHEIVSLTKPLSGTAEAYRTVRSSLLFQWATRGGEAPLLDAGEGQVFADATPSRSW